MGKCGVFLIGERGVVFFILKRSRVDFWYIRG